MGLNPRETTGKLHLFCSDGLIEIGKCIKRS